MSLEIVFPRMANIELRERFFGGGLVGTVETTPTLSWSEHSALIAAARGASDLASHTRAIGRNLEVIGLDIQATAARVAALEWSLGLRLDSQTQLLGEQVSLLTGIAEVMRTPAKTRAAERLVDVAELLRRKRWKRALAIAETVTEDDPNNPEGFLACAWANLGLGQIDLARDAYVEAAEASDGLRASELGRQAARLDLAITDGTAATETLKRFAVQDAPDWPQVSWPERDVLSDCIHRRTELGAVCYDRAVYTAAAGDIESSSEALRQAGMLSPIFLAAAQQDSVLVEHEALIEEAAELLEAATDAQQDRIAAQLERARSLQLESQTHQVDDPASDESLSALSKLLTELTDQSTMPQPIIEGDLMLSEMLLDHVEQMVLPARRERERAESEAEERRAREEHAKALLEQVREKAHELAAGLPGATVTTTGKATAMDGVSIPIWVVAQPGGLLKQPKKWHVSAGEDQPVVSRYY
jgi:tetratricopeptide (TPR) repeat protein